MKNELVVNHFSERNSNELVEVCFRRERSFDCSFNLKRTTSGELLLYYYNIIIHNA